MSVINFNDSLSNSLAILMANILNVAYLPAAASVADQLVKDWTRFLGLWFWSYGLNEFLATDPNVVLKRASHYNDYSMKSS